MLFGLSFLRGREALHNSRRLVIHGRWFFHPYEQGAPQLGMTQSDGQQQRHGSRVFAGTTIWQSHALAHGPIIA